VPVVLMYGIQAHGSKPIERIADNNITSMVDNTSYLLKMPMGQPLVVDKNRKYSNPKENHWDHY